MKTIVSYYDKNSGITMSLIHFPKFDGSLDLIESIAEKDTIEDGNRIIHVDYLKYKFLMID